ncbi:LA_2272 family surface repeat-containing protein [Candidatus Cloacimonadota bacterium]
MKKILILLFAITAVCCYGNNRFLELSVVYPLSTNKSKSDSTNVNLALFQNSLGYIHGFSFCGISAICKSDVKGLQASLLYSQINDNLKGVSFATVNVVNDSVKGVQSSLAANLLGRSFQGYQTAGIVNFVGGYFKGVQQSTVFNIIGRSFIGVQSAGAGNVVGENFTGAQIATTFNFTAKKMKGMQWSGMNVCGELHGLQLGYGNIAQKNYGWQIGLLNIAEEQKGIPIGFVNLSDDGNVQWQTYFSNFAGFITAIRFESNNFVSSLEMGGPNLESEIEESIMFGFHYGYRIPINKFGLEADFGYFHTMKNPENEDSDLSNSMAVQIRCSISYKVNRWLSIFAGVGGTSMADYPEDLDDEVENEKDSTLYFAGVNLF